MSTARKSVSNPFANDDIEIESSEVTLIKQIGSGIFGKVYEGICRGTKVALKVPTKQQLTPSEIELFKKEIAIMRKMTHPNVCLFMGAVVGTNNFTIVMELLKGDLENEILNNSHSSASLPQRLLWAKEAAQGMAWLHGFNPCIVHRDLKLSNLLVDESMNVKVTDFGLADLIQQGCEIRELKPKGSPLYMAPEVMKRQTITTKVDVYSFGILLWEIITKKPAFSHHKDLTTFSQCIVLKHERPPTQDLDPALADFLAKCWAPNPDDRLTFLDIVSKLDDLMLDVQIKDPAGKNFWKSNFTPKIKVPWNQFLVAFCREVGYQIPSFEEHELPLSPSESELQKSSLSQKREFARRSVEHYRRITSIFPSVCSEPDFLLTCLKWLFVHQGEEEVHLDQFVQVLGWLAPLDKTFITRFNAMVTSKWFHGGLSMTEAQERLRGEKAGTYLVRFSNNHPRHYVITKIGHKDFQNLLVLHVPSVGLSFNNKTYPTFDHLFNDCKKTHGLKRACKRSMFEIMATPYTPY